MNEAIWKQLSEEHQKIKDKEKYYLTHEVSIEYVVQELKAALGDQFISYTANAHDIDVKFKGGISEFKTMMKIMFDYDYKPRSKPVGEKFTEFSCWWDHKDLATDEPKFWIWFTSSVCTRVQIGTEMLPAREAAVYEIVCGNEEAA